MNSIKFWNGNKSAARQSYELELLSHCLPSEIEVDNTDYPSAEDEGNIFTTGCDVLVTVAGNVKFSNKDKIVINQPICKGLLGYRLLIIRRSSSYKFESLSSKEQLQELSIGIPATWADAELFRLNDYKVVEQGRLDDLFLRLQNKQFDYLALGANEIESLYTQLAEPLGTLAIQSSILLYYPLPLIFYVNPKRHELAEKLKLGLNELIQSGKHQTLFDKHHGDVVERLNLSSRKLITLTNPHLPQELAGFTPEIF
ncbi:hypothetical protein [Glaciecola sp. MF2-115]|uniref:hypothetical protein n=1 Tax=Glaciecola sp. MF2-115 TaxID=3384827 RepID=UPI0039A30A5D